MTISLRLLFVISLTASCEPASSPATSVTELGPAAGVTPTLAQPVPVAAAPFAENSTPTEQISTRPAAPLGEAPPVNASAQRSEVEPSEASSPRFVEVDTVAMLESMAAMRTGLAGKQLRAFDMATMQVMQSAMKGMANGDDESAGPAGDLIRALGAIQGLDAATILKKSETAKAQFGGGARPNANESAAIATLKNIASAQAQCRASGAIDEDGDGKGEYGSFSELSGGDAVRGSNGEKRISPPVLSAAFGRVKAGVVARSGYAFQLWLPANAQGAFVSERDQGSKDLIVGAEASERAFRCYAWPLERGTSGKRAFYIDQNGDVLACRNERQGWSGMTRRPRVFDALKMGSNIEAAANEVGQSGEKWSVVR